MGGVGNAERYVGGGGGEREGKKEGTKKKKAKTWIQTGLVDQCLNHWGMFFCRLFFFFFFFFFV